MGKLLEAAIKTYQKWLSPLLGNRCRFYPSCSHFALGCLEKYPKPTALSKIIIRLLKCNPWNPGGVDLP